MSSIALALLLACVAVSMTACAATRAGPAPPSGKGGVELVAHRGESHDAPENTLAAITLAWSRGAEAVEFDVRLSSDGQLVAIHDADTERVTGGRAKLVVAQQTAESLRQLDVGSWKSSTFAGEQMPTLAEVLATLPADPSKRLFIEVKVGPEATEPLAAALGAEGRPPEQAAVISFNLETCRSVKERLPKLKVYFLSGFKKDERTGEARPTLQELIDAATGATLNGLDLSHHGPIDSAYVKRVHDAGLEMHVWTVDDPAEARRLVDAGVDGITTNRAQWMRRQLGGTR